MSKPTVIDVLRGEVEGLKGSLRECEEENTDLLAALEGALRRYQARKFDTGTERWTNWCVGCGHLAEPPEQPHRPDCWVPKAQAAIADARKE